MLVMGLAWHWAVHPDRKPLGTPAGLQVTFVTAGGGDGSEVGPGTFADNSADAEADRSDAPPQPPHILNPAPRAQAPVELTAADAAALESAYGKRTKKREPSPPRRSAPEQAKTAQAVVPASVATKPTGQSDKRPANGAGGAGRSSGLGPLGNGMARTEVFGAAGEGRKFSYVFDRSGSMDGHRGAPLRAAKAELLASLADLGQTQQFQIIFYNEQPRVFSPSGSPGRLVFATDQNKYLAQKFVGSITADGGTKHEEALEMALKTSPDVIFFLTDADEPRMDSRQLARIGRLNRGSIINAIEFGYGPQRDADNFLVELATRNGGKHVYIDVARLEPKR
jgi:hypothetical protein